MSTVPIVYQTATITITTKLHQQKQFYIHADIITFQSLITLLRKRHNRYQWQLIQNVSICLVSLSILTGPSDLLDHVAIIYQCNRWLFFILAIHNMAFCTKLNQLLEYMYKVASVYINFDEPTLIPTCCAFCATVVLCCN